MSFKLTSAKVPGCPIAIPESLLVLLLLCLNVSCAETDKQPAISSSGTAVSESTIESTAGPFVSLAAGSLMCFSVNTLIVDRWDDPNLLQVINRLQPDVLRIPGGTVANYWDWKRGGLLLNPKGLQETPRILQQPRATRYDSGKLKNFAPLFKATGADAMLVLNMLTADLKSQMAFIGSAMAAGLPIKYVELGNEFYRQERNYVKEFPSAQAYAGKAARWAEAIKSQFPGIKVGIQGVSLRFAQMKSEQRFVQWNDVNIQQSLPEADALTLHEYHPVPQLGNAPSAASRSTGYGELVSGLFANDSALLNQRNRKEFPADKQIWITEYNLFTGAQSRWIAGTWMHGLYVAAMSATFLQEKGVSIACNHVLVGDANFGAILADRDVLRPGAYQVGQTRQAAATKPFALSASGQALVLFSQAVDGKQRASQLRFSAVTAKKAQPDLYGWLFEGTPKARSAFIVNLSDRSVSLKSPDFFTQGPAWFEQIAADPALQITSGEEVPQSSGRVSEVVVLPAYSVTYVHSN